jgi:DNA mismatch repair protein MutL
MFLKEDKIIHNFCLENIEIKTHTNLIELMNRHPVQDGIISAAVREALDGVLPKGEYPGLLLVLTIPPSQVDVNVHPTKREVRFRNGQMVFTAVLGALTKALEKETPVFHVGKIEPPVFSNGTAKYSASPPQQTKGGVFFSKTAIPSATKPGHLPKEMANQLLTVSTKEGWAYLGEVEGVYLLFETPKGELLVVDKHACHERMLYDQIVGEDRPPIPLLAPFKLALSPEELDLIEENRQLIEALGFRFKIKDGNVLINEIPFWAKNRIEEAFKKAVELKGESNKKEVLARWACREAVKAGDATGLMDVEAMARWLQSGGEELTCPHGRPIVVRLTKGLLDRLFKRRM